MTNTTRLTIDEAAKYLREYPGILGPFRCNAKADHAIKVLAAAWLAEHPNVEVSTWPEKGKIKESWPRPTACPTDVCRAAKGDGIVCPPDSCDIDDGIRKPPGAVCPHCGFANTILDLKQTTWLCVRCFTQWKVPKGEDQPISPTAEESEAAEPKATGMPPTTPGGCPAVTVHEKTDGWMICIPGGHAIGHYDDEDFCRTDAETIGGVLADLEQRLAAVTAELSNLQGNAKAEIKRLIESRRAAVARAERAEADALSLRGYIAQALLRLSRKPRSVENEIAAHGLLVAAIGRPIESQEAAGGATVPGTWGCE